MRPGTSRNRVAEKWKRLLEGTLAAILLLPMPAFAAISAFTWNGTGIWQSSGGDVDPFSSVDTSLTSSSQGILRLYMNSASGHMSGSDTWSITSTFTVTDSSTSIGGTWLNLSNFSSLQGTSGGITASVTLSPASPNGSSNMFSNTYNGTTGAPPSSAGLTNLGPLAMNTTYTVTVQFSFFQVGFTPWISTPIMLTLQQP